MKAPEQRIATNTRAVLDYGIAGQYGHALTGVVTGRVAAGPVLCWGCIDSGPVTEREVDCLRILPLLKSWCHRHSSLPFCFRLEEVGWAAYLDNLIPSIGHVGA